MARVTKAQRAIAEQLLERYGEVDEFTVGQRIRAENGDSDIADGEGIRKLGIAVLSDLVADGKCTVRRLRVSAL